MNSTSIVLDKPAKQQIWFYDLVKSFDAYCLSQESSRPIWFIVSMYTLISGFIPLSAVAVFYLYPQLGVPYVAFALPTFFANVLIYGFDLKMKTNLSLYFATALIHIGFAVLALIMA